MATDYIDLSGSINIEIVNADTDEIITTATPQSNLTSINREIRQAMLMGTTTSYTINDLNIKYIALGDGETAFTPSDTQLENEIYRRKITAKSVEGNVVTTICSFSANIANYDIKEVGIFAGDNATSTANTGNLISRFLVDFTKTSNIILNIYHYYITII